MPPKGRTNQKDSVGVEYEETPPPPSDQIWKAFTCALEAHMTATNKRMDELIMSHTQEISILKSKAAAERVEQANVIMELHKSLDYLHSAVDDIKSELSQLKSGTGAAQERVEVAVKQCQSVEQKDETTIEKLDYIENQSRRLNLRFEGIVESPRVDWNGTERKVTSFITEKLNLPHPSIERAHRIGKFISTSYSNTNPKPRTVVVKFTSYNEKEAVLAAACTLRDSRIIAYQDYSQRVQEKRQQLLPEMRQLRQQGTPAFIAYDSKEGARLVQPKSRLHPPPPWNTQGNCAASGSPVANSDASLSQVMTSQPTVEDGVDGTPPHMVPQGVSSERRGLLTSSVTATMTTGHVPTSGNQPSPPYLYRWTPSSIY